MTMANPNNAAFQFAMSIYITHHTFLFALSPIYFNIYYGSTRSAIRHELEEVKLNRLQ